MNGRKFKKFIETVVALGFLLGMPTAAVIIVAILSMRESEVEAIGPVSSDFGNSMEVKRIEDDKYRVVCWVAIGSQRGGIWCIPESQLEQR